MDTYTKRKKHNFFFLSVTGVACFLHLSKIASTFNLIYPSNPMEMNILETTLATTSEK